MIIKMRPVPEPQCCLCEKRIKRGTFGCRCMIKSCDKVTHKNCWDKHNADKHRGKADYKLIKS